MGHTWGQCHSNKHNNNGNDKNKCPCGNGHNDSNAGNAHANVAEVNNPVETNVTEIVSNEEVMEIIDQEMEPNAPMINLSLEEMEIDGMFACTHEVHMAILD